MNGQRASENSSPPLGPVHIWVPGIYDFKGGIQAFSGFLASALEESVGRERVCVLDMNDRSSERLIEANPQLHCAGWVPRLLRRYVFALISVRRAMRDKPSLIIITHLHFAPAAFIASLLSGAPYWVILHGVEAWTCERPYLRGPLRRASRILSVSRYTKVRVCQAFDLVPDRVDLFPNTFDDERFCPGERPAALLARHQLPIDARVVLTVARLDARERYKGYDAILRALPHVCEAVPKVYYLIVGTGDDLERAQLLASELGVRNNVVFAGSVSDDDLPLYYRLCDVFAMPSTGEGFGIVFLEALGVGKPVIAGNRDGSCDAIAGGELGLLVDPGDPYSIGKAIVELLLPSLPSGPTSRSEFLRAEVLRRFGRKAFATRLQNLLKLSGIAQ